MNEIIKCTIYVLFMIILAVVSYYVLPYVKTLASNERNKELIDVITRAVKYAEQTIIGSGKGKEKLNTVQMYVSEWLKNNGIDISERELRVLIESAVYVMNNETKQ